ncbi:MAG: peptide-methionine (S)-S-oxide reductase MsrA [Flavobacteriaceae bacterium]|nr:peptide-methionine (S)-S-oxide reductase MsrA [Flavobacteriaceae bacterium]
MEQAILGGGCFWCIEAVFKAFKGVESVESGFSGGHIKNPAYREVCTGRTGHAEVVKISFNPEIISYETLLELFFTAHVPTTLNRQGNDVGTQYRSVIFYLNEAQRTAAENIKQQFESEKIYENPIVTEIKAATKFYPAEDYHTDYFELHPEEPYCAAVISPKVQKVKQKFRHLLKN